MAPKSKAGTLALLVSLLLAAPAKVEATADLLTDVRRPLVPPEPPSEPIYRQCYPAVSGSVIFPLFMVRNDAGQFDYTKPASWDLALKIQHTVGVLRRNGRDPLAAELFGVWLTLQHEFDAAIESFEAADELAAAATREAEDPRAFVERCLRGSPERILVNLANTAMLAGDLERARRSLARVKTPGDLAPVTRLRWYWLRAELAARDGDLAGAEEMLAAAESVDASEALGDSPDVERRRAAAQAYFRALVAERAGDLEAAASAYDVAAQGGVLDAQIGLATVYAELARYEDGIDELETLTKARPQGSMMRPEIVAYDLGNLRTIVGDTAGARTAYRSALFTVAERSCEYFENANFNFDRYCDLEPICVRLEAIQVDSSCRESLTCFDRFPHKTPDTWWSRALCRSLEPDVFVAAHNNFAMNLAQDPESKASVERHLRLAIEGAHGSEAAKIPLMNLARTRWQRGERESAIAALFELTEAGGDPRLAASSLWAWLSLDDAADADDLRPIEAFVDLAEQARTRGSTLFRGEISTVEGYLAALADTDETDASTRSRASELLSSLALSPTTDAPSLGPVDAPVTVVAFDDFGCAYCVRSEEPLRAARESFGDRVRFVFRQFPQNGGPTASKPNEAVLCAADQGRFWELSDRLFGLSARLSVDQLKDAARDVDGLDVAAFETCLDSGEKAAEVAADLRAATRMGLAASGAIFVNGRMVPATAGADGLAAVIEEELRRTQADPF